jgi:hypothetical protein
MVRKDELNQHALMAHEIAVKDFESAVGKHLFNAETSDFLNVPIVENFVKYVQVINNVLPACHGFVRYMGLKPGIDKEDEEKLQKFWKYVESFVEENKKLMAQNAFTLLDSFNERIEALLKENRKIQPLIKKHVSLE